jgi:hypothetical protein
MRALELPDAPRTKPKADMEARDERYNAADDGWKRGGLVYWLGGKN